MFGICPPFSVSTALDEAATALTKMNSQKETSTREANQAAYPMQAYYQQAAMGATATTSKMPLPAVRQEFAQQAVAQQQYAIHQHEKQPVSQCNSAESIQAVQRLLSQGMFDVHSI